jgi:ribosomal protein S6
MGPGDVVAEIERNLRLLDTVLKFMTVKIDDDLIPEERLNRPEEEEEEPLPYQGEEE